MRKMAVAKMLTTKLQEVLLPTEFSTRVVACASILATPSTKSKETREEKGKMKVSFANQ